MILLLPAGLDCPRCGSWSVVMDAELEPVPRSRTTGTFDSPRGTGFVALLANAAAWWDKLDAEKMLRPLWRCATCSFVYSDVTQELIAGHIAEVEIEATT